MVARAQSGKGQAEGFWMMEWSSPSFGEGMALAEAVDERADAGDRARRERRFHDARACHAPEDTPSHPHFSNTLNFGLTM